ncbi:FBD-associated F-box protein At1g61320-like [Punica granatum]|uniref:FBD-associated F-box protein At1g61320-like n=1 Tax=Punica granatum TaxID=22663 RepID=A0A6P8DVW5_PUNGR|nr:FBD-associated F-box protein At1g61320-like [Punica granatum]
MLEGVEELDLDFFGATSHLLFPFDLSSIHSLRILELSFCQINFPLTLNNLHLLETLVLSRVRSPEDLILAGFKTVSSLKNCFENIARLRDAVLNIAAPGGLKLNHQIKDIIWDLARLRTLTVSASFVEDLCPTYKGGALQRMQFSLLLLSEVQLLMEDAIYCNHFDIALFLMNCPCVEKLFIDLNGWPFQGSVYWKMYLKQGLEQIQ